MKTFLLCDDVTNAELVDYLVMEKLRETGTQGSRWSGVYTDGTRFGVLWGDAPARLFNFDEVELLSVLVTEEEGSEWEEVVPEEVVV